MSLFCCHVLICNSNFFHLSLKFQTQEAFQGALQTQKVENVSPDPKLSPRHFVVMTRCLLILFVAAWSEYNCHRFKFSLLICAFRWDPKKRMTPDEAIHHEWLLPSSSSSTFILSSSTSASSLIKHSRSEQLKENEQSQQQLLSKYQRSQPITPMTVLPQIKTPNNQQQRNQPVQRNVMVNGIVKDASRIKSK